MNKQGRALIIALVLMIFITTLGMIVLHTAHMMQALSIERSVQRPPQIVLESLIVYACKTQGAEWLKLKKKTTDTLTTDSAIPEVSIVSMPAQVQAPIHESYSTTINSTACTLTITSEKGGVVLHASCPGKRGVTHRVSAHLEAQGEQAVIRAWQRSS
jgi:hypothetical protein